MTRNLPASLQAQNPQIGHNDLGQNTEALDRAGLSTQIQPMPANTLLLIARKTHSPQ